MMGAGMMVSSQISSTRPSVPGEVGGVLSQIEGINQTVGVIEDFVQVRGEMLSLAGVEPDKLAIAFTVTLVAGHDLEWALANGISNPLLIDETASAIVGFGINDTILMTGLMSSSVYEFYIVGMTSAFQIDLSFIMAGFAYTTLEYMQDTMATTNVQYFMITLEDGYDMNTMKATIQAAYPEADVTTSEDVIAMSEQIMDMIFAVLMAIGSISLLVGGLMITNTTMMSVLERTREIGIVKSIGGKRTHVLTIFITEAVMIAMIGGIVGCILSVVAVTGLTGIVYGMYGFPLAYSLEPWIFMAGLGMAGGIGAIAGAFPSWRAASVKPVEALRYQ